jgi:pyridoxal-phosphate dependent enzyme
VKVAVLDDYQRVALSYPYWSTLPADVAVVPFHDHVPAADLPALLEPFDVVVAMRERTPLPDGLLKTLPRLKLIVTAGMANAAIDMRAARVQELLRVIPNGFWPNQYANARNAESHHRTTIEEIVRDCGEVDYLLVAASTCGTLRGCHDYLRENRLRTRLIAVDALGSVIFGGEKQKRLLPGMGAAMTPPLCPSGAIERVIYASDLESIVGCRRLLLRESIFAGASSGGVMAAVEKLAAEVEPGSTCVAILPDRGERYLDTVFSNAWVYEHFGDIEHHWTASSRPAMAEVALASHG